MTAVDPPADPTLTAYLAGRDQPCPQCGYNLRQLAGSRCPECGGELALRLGLVEPRLATLVAGLVALSAGAGFDALLLTVFAILSIVHNSGSSNEPRLIRLLALCLVVEGAALYGWVREWPQVRRAGRAVRLLLVAVCWGLTLANLAAFSVAVVIS